MIDLSSLDSEPPPKATTDPWRPRGIKKKKKKSLFAQQFGDKDLSFFGIESVPVDGVPQNPLLFRKDIVEPVCIGGDTVEGEEVRESHDMEQEAVPGAGGVSEDISDVLSGLSVDEILHAKEEYEKKLGMNNVSFFFVFR